MIAAIDPGAKGAMALLDGENIVGVWDLSKEPEELIFDVLNDHGVKLCIVERVGVMPHDSKIASFSFGENVGRILSACSLSDCEVERVKPKVWQSWCKIYGTGKTKQLGFELLRRVYGPELFMGPRGGLKDGRVDAVLIGLWFINNRTTK